MGWGGWWFLGGKDLKEELPPEPIVPLPPEFVLDDVPLNKENNMGMKISQKGIDFIKQQEGLRTSSYLDSVGVWTIGYGTIMVNGKKVTANMHCSPLSAEQWLKEEIEKVIEPAINKLVKVPINQDMFDVFCSFCYNLGTGAFSTSTMLKMLNAKDYANAAAQILRWNKGKVNGRWTVITGLDNRRKAEYSILSKAITEFITSK